MDNDTLTTAQAAQKDDESSVEETDYTEPCNGSRCKTCQQIVLGNTLDRYTCQSSNVVYKISTAGLNYIGITTASLSKRMTQHRHAIIAGHGDGEKFIEHFRRENFDDAKITILDTATNKHELREKERYWINYYDSHHNGLNSTS